VSHFIPVEPEKWMEMVKAQAENAVLKAEVERLTAFTTRTIIPNEELQAEVKRLTARVNELNAAIITGKAIVPDAEIYHE